MKPVNITELKRAYFIFSLHFMLLIAFSLLCLYFFFAGSSAEYRMLQERSDRIARAFSIREDVNKEFDIIQFKFGELSRYQTFSAEEMDDQLSTLESIRAANIRNRALIAELDPKSNSCRLYKKLSDDMAMMVDSQDSLFNTRFQIESLRTQLESCMKTHQLAAEKLNGDLFRR